MSPFRFHELNTDGFLMKRLMSDFLNLRCPYNELSHTFRYVEGGGGTLTGNRKSGLTML